MADPYLATLDLARRLIACPSVTPAHAGCLDIVADRLAAAGFTCERIDRAGVANLWARRGEEAPIVCLAGHVDVVPPGPVEQWTSDPFTPTERDGFLYGRGAADMKMSVAAMVTAAERVFATDAPRHGSLALLLTSDEEGDAVNGTAAVVDELKARGVTVDACIIGEPTSVDWFGDTVKNGRRGLLNGALRVKGVQCHIAYPERGRNPIHFALPALAELASLVWDRGNEYFPPTSFQISNIQAGTGATNIIPGSLDVLFNVRFSPESTVDAVKARVHAVLDERGLDYELRWSPPGLPFMTARGALVTAMGEAIQSVTGIEPSLSTSGGTSDGRFLATIARQVVEFGPSNASIHGIDERVSLRDIAPLSMIYERVVRALLAGG